MEDHYLNERIHQILQGKINMGAGVHRRKKRRAGGVVHKRKNPWLSFLADRRAEGYTMKEAANLYHKQGGAYGAGKNAYSEYVHKQKLDGIPLVVSRAQWNADHPKVPKVRKNPNAKSRKAKRIEELEELVAERIPIYRPKTIKVAKTKKAKLTKEEKAIKALLKLEEKRVEENKIPRSLTASKAKVLTKQQIINAYNDLVYRVPRGGMDY